MAAQVSIGVFTVALLGVAVAVGASALTAWGLMSTTRTTQNLGTIKTVNLGAYWNSACTNVTSTVNWGTLSPGNVANVSFYLRNEGNTPMRLSLTTQAWSPAIASSHMSLSWNREGQTLAGGNVIQATLTLNVSPSISGVTSFSFDTVITGSEQ